MRLWRVLGSRRTAAYLLAAISGILAFATIVPNQDYLDKKSLAFIRNFPTLLDVTQRYLTLDSITSSWTFMALLSFLMISLCYCSFRRLRNELILSSRTVTTTMPRAARRIVLPASVDTLASQVSGLLPRRGWRTTLSNSRGRYVIAARKGHLGFWGSVIFHAGLILTFASGIYYGLSGFSGEIVIAEGQTLTFAKENMVSYKQARIRREPPAYDIKLEELRPVRENDRLLKDFSGRIVALTRTGEVRQTVRVNQPFVHEGYRFLAHRYGFSPEFVIVKDGHHELFDSFVNLIVFTPDQVDRFQVPEEQLEVRARFFPDLEIKGKRVSTKSVVPRNPAFLLQVVKGGESVFSGLVKKGETVKFDHYELSFPELRYWVDFLVSANPAYPYLVVSTLIVTLGLSLRFLFPDKKLLVAISPSRANGQSIVRIAGHCRQFPALFKQELDGIERDVCSIASP